MSENQKLREVATELDRLMLVIESAVRHADPRNHASVMALIAANKEALALPTADHIPDAGEMVADHLPEAGKVIETAAPVGELELFERTMMDKFGWERKDFKTDGRDFYMDGNTVTAWMAWQARAALSAGDAVYAHRYRWLMHNCTLGIKQNGVGWSLNTTACIAPDCIKDVGATIDAAMRKGQL